MMPSVIPARLQFQCGHAALVTLPRVKGETATQRNDRVAREKSAALSRQCDFCAPANGNNHVAEVLEVNLPITETLPVDAPVEEVVIIAEAPFEAPTLETSSFESPAATAQGPVVETAFPEPSEIEVAPSATDATDETPVAATAAATDEAKPARKLRSKRQASPAEVARGQRFLVEYRWERIVRADTIHDALRQLSTSGAEDVVEITRL